MAPPLLKLSDIHLTFGGTPLLEGAEIIVGAGERICLVGRNGSGKSTLLKIAAGEIQADGGERFLQPGTTLRFLRQEPDLGGFATTQAYVEAGLAPGDEAHRASYLLEQLGLSGQEDPAQLSGGEKRRTALARALAPRPDILLLDEPTNHLDLPTIEWLEQELKGLRSALILISHDRRFLQNLGQSVIWLERGETMRLDKGFENFESWRDEIIEQEQVARHKLSRKIETETQWLHKGVTARRKRNMGRLRALVELRKTRRAQRRIGDKVEITVSQGTTSGKRVIEAVGVSKAYGPRDIVKDFSTRILRGDRVGILGPNGAGKTTLLNLLTGQDRPDSGTIILGSKLEVATIDQGRASLDPNTTLQDALTGGAGDAVVIAGESRHVTSYMKDFLFSPKQARTPISRLSGGERGRLMLARALARPSNLLILDEPTNDLDIETLDLLQEMLSDYAGTVLLVSHDRDFIDRVVTSVIVSEGQGRWQEYAGGYSDMLQQGGGKVTGRGAPARSDKEKQKAGVGKAKAPARPAGKMSFKDKHALETLPQTMAEMEKAIAALNAELADPTLYSRNPERFTKVTKAVMEKTSALAKCEEDWLRLELLREELQGRE